MIKICSNAVSDINLQSEFRHFWIARIHRPLFGRQDFLYKLTLFERYQTEGKVKHTDLQEYLQEKVDNQYKNGANDRKGAILTSVLWDMQNKISRTRQMTKDILKMVSSKYSLSRITELRKVDFKRMRTVFLQRKGRNKEVQNSGWWKAKWIGKNGEQFVADQPHWRLQRLIGVELVQKVLVRNSMGKVETNLITKNGRPAQPLIKVLEKQNSGRSSWKIWENIL